MNCDPNRLSNLVSSLLGRTRCVRLPKFWQRFIHACRDVRCESLESLGRSDPLSLIRKKVSSLAVGWPSKLSSRVRCPGRLRKKERRRWTLEYLNYFAELGKRRTGFVFFPRAYDF